MNDLTGGPLLCPKCERPARPSPFLDDDHVRCLCCNRPWIGCPCTPAPEGECQAIDASLPYVFDWQDEPPDRHRPIRRFDAR